MRLVCPYHNWSYDLDGRLLFARDMAQAASIPKALGLKPVACESAAGYVWICLADEPPDFAPFRAAMEPYFAPHRLDEAKVAFESTIVENGNWKLVWENNRECYHCAPNHPELCRTFPEAPTISGVERRGGRSADCRALGALRARGAAEQLRDLGATANIASPACRCCATPSATRCRAVPAVARPLCRAGRRAGDRLAA